MPKLKENLHRTPEMLTSLPTKLCPRCLCQLSCCRKCFKLQLMSTDKATQRAIPKCAARLSHEAQLWALKLIAIGCAGIGRASEEERKASEEGWTHDAR
eukprot:6468851-Amphidinium_carterae.1